MSNNIQLIKDKINIVDLVAAKVSLKKRGHNYVGLCPFHNEKTPSFNVNEIKQYYHCFGCGAHGNIFDFTINTQNIDFKEAIKQLASQAGIKLTSYNRIEYNENELLYKINQDTLEWFQSCLYRNERALEYCYSRNLNKEILGKFSIGYADKKYSLVKHLLTKNYHESMIIKASLGWLREDGKLMDSFYDRLIFPIFSTSNKVIAFAGRIIESDQQGAKYKNSAETNIFQKKQNLFNLNNAKNTKKQHLIICEGYMDVIAFKHIGIESAVAPMGTAISKEQIELVWRYDKHPIFCFDGDEAGRKASLRLIEISLDMINIKQGYKVVLLPENADPDDMIKNGNVNLLNKLLANPLEIYEVIWRFYAGNYQLLSAQDKAKIDYDLQTITARIKDKFLQKHYRSYFYQKMWESKKKSQTINVNLSLNIEEIDRVNAYLLILYIINYEKLYMYDEQISKLDLNKILLNIYESFLNEEQFSYDFLLEKPYSLNTNILNAKDNIEKIFEYFYNKNLIYKLNLEILNLLEKNSDSAHELNAIDILEKERHYYQSINKQLHQFLTNNND